MSRIILLLAAVAGRAFAASPSFDCARAAGGAEKLICSRDALAEADRRLAALYKPLPRCLTGAASAELRKRQREWLAGLDACAAAGTDPARINIAARCVTEAFAARIAELEALAARECAQIGRAASRPDFLTYRDKRYGFELSFPEAMTASSKFVGHYHVEADRWRQGFYEDPKHPSRDPGTLVVSVAAYRPNGDRNYPDVEVRVGVRSGATQEEACGGAPGDGVAGPPARIGGRVFQVSDLSNAGMSQSITGESYRTFKGGYCFAVERFVTDTSIVEEGHEQEKRRTEAAAESSYRMTKEIVESFRLLQD